MKLPFFNNKRTDPGGIVIESGIPVPAKHPGGIGEFDATLIEMKPGDSFAYPESKSRSAIRSAAARLGIKLVIRRERVGIRVWRTE